MNNKNMIPVESSNLKSVSYENQDLYVLFHNGGFYKYLNVPENLYDQLLNASSKGKFLNEKIKKIFKYEKIK